MSSTFRSDTDALRLNVLSGITVAGRTFACNDDPPTGNRYTDGAI